MSRNLAVITARGGSKRIPRKNIREFCGRPIIEYSIEAAQRTGIFDEIMVSTDDAEIAEVAQKAGAKVPFFRSPENSNDFATTVDVLMEVFKMYRQSGISWEYACCLYPTAPFLQADMIKEGMQVLEEKKATKVMPVVRFSYPPQRCYRIEEQSGELLMKWPENYRKRSQDLEPLYHDCGQFYCYDVREFLAERYLERVFPIVMDEMYVQDIDTPEDWKLAELKYKLMKGRVDGEDEAL